MTTGTDPTELVDNTISVAAHLEAELAEALAGHRLTRPSYLVLAALARPGGGRMSQRDLVTAVRRTSGTLSVRLGRLERARFIEREPDPENRRSVTVTLTERGRELLEAARPAYAERAGRLAGGIPSDRAGDVASGLGAWLEFFEPEEQHVAPRLGVAVAPAAVAKRMRSAVGLPDEPGVLVVGVKRDSAADAAGLGRGDLITRAGGQSVQSVGDLHRAVRGAARAVILGVVRGADRREVEVALSPGAEAAREGGRSS